MRVLARILIAYNTVLFFQYLELIPVGLLFYFLVALPLASWQTQPGQEE